MTLGIVSDEISRDLREAVRIGKRAGILRYELRNLTTGRIPRCEPWELQLVDDLVRDEGIEVSALSPGLFKYTTDAAGFAREMAEVYPRASELAHRWRLPALIVFGFHKRGATEANASSFSSDHPPAEVREWLARAGERAAADQLRLLIEPEPICWADTGRATLVLIQASGASSVGINYDPGNVAWLWNRDPQEEFAIVSPWMENLHIKDLRPLTEGAAHPQWVPAGEGMVDYRALFRELRRIGYRGPVSLEPHMDGSEETIRRCKEAVESIGSEERREAI